jgi:hypothetical protein
MIIVKKIIWDFSDTDFEDCLYEEATKVVCLPKTLDIEDLDEESNDYEIREYLTENYGFEIKSYEVEE